MKKPEIKYTLKKEKAKEEDYYECKRCDKNSVKNPEYASCPCPRGSCEAEIVGKVITTTQIFLAPKKPKKKLTKKDLEESMNLSIETFQNDDYFLTSPDLVTIHEKKRKTRNRSKSNRK